jgi:hypothetical protein
VSGIFLTLTSSSHDGILSQGLSRTVVYVRRLSSGFFLSPSPRSVFDKDLKAWRKPARPSAGTVVRSIERL